MVSLGILVHSHFERFVLLGPMRLLLIILLPNLLVFGCSQSKAPSVELQAPPSGGASVATFKGGQITSEEVKRRLDAMPSFARSNYQSLNKKQQLLEEMARFEILAEEAMRQGVHKHPDVADAAKRVMVQKLLETRLTEMAAPVTDPELLAYYEAHRGEYNRPEQLRLTEITLEASPGPHRARQKAAAQKLRAQALKLESNDSSGLTSLAASMKAEAEPLRFMTLEELGKQRGPLVAQSASLLKNVGDLSEVIESEKGFHIIKLQARQSSVVQEFPQVKEQLRMRLAAERKQRAYEQLTAEMSKRAGLQIDEKALEAIQMDAPPAPQAASAQP